MRRVRLIVLTTAILAVPPAASGSTRPDAPEPWATVNLCDTEKHQNQIGVRGSMPGLERRTGMYMRFRVQYRNHAGAWRTVRRGAGQGPAPDSGWLNIGTGRGGEYDAGWTFEFVPPKAGGAWELRGVVSYRWHRAGRVVVRDRRFTEAGHPGTAGAEPADFSDDTCAIA
jgi:hypothetical protein